jgi:octaprenyl-diphosphate synthase
MGKMPDYPCRKRMTFVNPKPAVQPVEDLAWVRNLVARDMAEVDRLIQRRLYSDVDLINQLGAYIVNSGGKRLRPLLVLLGAGVFSYHGKHHIELAAIIEFIHTATLLHDDVVDASLLRRGQKTANQRWGNEASVLVGDFLYSRAFQMMVDVDSMRIMDIMSETTNIIAEGEVQQLINCHNPDTSEESYFKVIHNKTAKLFEAGARVGAVLSDRSLVEEQAVADYGRHLGMAYQLIDDVLDYRGNAAELGKNIGDDLAEGKPTLPLLYAMAHGTPRQSEQIRNTIASGGLGHLSNIMQAIEATDALTYTANLARQESELALRALSGLPESDYLDALRILAQFAVNRTH